MRCHCRRSLGPATAIVRRLPALSVAGLDARRPYAPRRRASVSGPRTPVEPRPSKNGLGATGCGGRATPQALSVQPGAPRREPLPAAQRGRPSHPWGGNDENALPPRPSRALRRRTYGRRRYPTRRRLPPIAGIGSQRASVESARPGVSSREHRRQLTQPNELIRMRLAVARSRRRVEPVGHRVEPRDRAGGRARGAEHDDIRLRLRHGTQHRPASAPP